MRFDTPAWLSVNYQANGGPNSVQLTVTLKEYPDLRKIFSTQNVIVENGKVTLFYVP
jgi:hypothetical protein